MKASIQKLRKFFKLEADRGFDDRAVMGGLENMLEQWEGEARADGLADDLVQLVTNRLRDYHRLSPESRNEVLVGLWNRIQREHGGEIESSPGEREKRPTLPPSSSKPKPEEPAPKPPKTTAPKLPEKPKPEGPPAALDAPTTVLDGVGEKNAEKLERLGIRTLGDMLYHFPRRYDDYSLLKPIKDLTYDEEVTVIGTIESVNARKLKGRKRRLVEMVLGDGTGALRVSWFNQPWLTRSLKEGSQVVLAGKIDQYLGRLTMTNPEWELLEQENLHTNRIVPVYPLTAKITQRWLRRLMSKVVAYWAPRVQDPLPKEMRASAELIEQSAALEQIHFPDSWEFLKAAQHRLAFDEILLLQLGVLRQKQTWASYPAEVYEVPDAWIQDQIGRLPFELTQAQQRALKDLRADLASGHPMNRLIQGDVGSGKTVIAALGIGIVIQGDAQAAIMAPTSILAEQHYHSLQRLLVEGGELLQPDQLRLLIGATPESEKNAIRQGLQDGSIKVVVGTHALLEDPVSFENLQLAVIDEQHRFGVAQRATLRAKSDNPHLLVMTATPIPRSLALTVYGDLDLSVIDEMPPGRQPVETHLQYPRERERAYSFIRKQLDEGHQAFIIYPLVEESEKSDSKAAVEEHQRLEREVFINYSVGLLHGRLKPDEKEAVMARFRDGDHQVLVSTSVVEVGVDVPNATVMMVEGANLFGLAQLHQFRGRVGRGEAKAYCLLIPESEHAADNERLQAMMETNDGFVLAEYDLEQRGPGEFLGSRQSGFSDLRMASLSDVRLIEKARRHAQELIQQDPELSQPQHQLLAAALQGAWDSDQGDIS